MSKNLPLVVLVAVSLLLSSVAFFSGGRATGGISTLKATFGDGYEVVSELGTVVMSVTKAGVASITGTLDVSGDTKTGELTQGGGVYATTTTAATETITGTVLDENNVIRFLGSATAAAMTATIQATSSWPTTLIPSAGDYRSWVIENGYTAAATTTTMAAGAGVDLQEPDGQNVVIGINNYAWLTCFREASTDVVCRVDETIPAD